MSEPRCRGRTITERVWNIYHDQSKKVLGRKTSHNCKNISQGHRHQEKTSRYPKVKQLKQQYTESSFVS